MLEIALDNDDSLVYLTMLISWSKKHLQYPYFMDTVRFEILLICSVPVRSLYVFWVSSR